MAYRRCQKGVPVPEWGAFPEESRSCVEYAQSASDNTQRPSAGHASPRRRGGFTTAGGTPSAADTALCTHCVRTARSMAGSRRAVRFTISCQSARTHHASWTGLTSWHSATFATNIGTARASPVIRENFWEFSGTWG